MRFINSIAQCFDGQLRHLVQVSTLLLAKESVLAKLKATCDISTDVHRTQCCYSSIRICTRTNSNYAFLDGRHQAKGLKVQKNVLQLFKPQKEIM